MTRVLLVNASHPAYNLGLEKARRWWEEHGADVVDIAQDVPTLGFDYDVVWISAIFSWHVPKLVAIAWTAIHAGAGSVEVGGPGTFGLRDYIRWQTGLRAQATPDPRFERQAGAYRMVFWSRGCPAYNCTLGYPRDGAPPICSVPAMEGERLSLYDVTPAPIILDNNLSALPAHHQERIIERTLEAGFGHVDCNSGFEPASFRVETAQRWKRLPLVAWRFAYDELAERAAVLTTMAILDEIGVARYKRHIYCLAGNEPIADCEARVNEINTWGCKPWVQVRQPLDWLGGELPAVHDWSHQTLIDFRRWGNRLAKGIPWSEYRRGFKDRHRAGALV